MPTAFQQRIAVALADAPRVRAVHLATLHKVDARQAAMRRLGDADALRRLAADIKRHTLDHLSDYLEQFTEAVERLGGHVHVARDAAAARRIICDIAARAGARLAVKSKSMTSEEIDLNEALARGGVRTVETDLGEFIVQIDGDRPSHIVTPIIHKNRAQVARAMQRELGCEYTEDPSALTGIARGHLRRIFRQADLGISGVNFAAADTGTLCICTNEGNGRMTTTCPRVHVALMGIEKLIPRLADLPVFLKLLARSSTGQPLTVYTNLVTGPRRPTDPDGPEHLHVVLLDHGRSSVLCSPFADVLRCIRCGACLNACPVYRQIGGHAYGGVYPGPIGSLVTPLLAGAMPKRSESEALELPRASSLCGACRGVCPVDIDIPRFLLMLRQHGRDRQPLAKRLVIRLWRSVMLRPWAYRAAQWLLRRWPAENGWIRTGWGPLGAWTSGRDLPTPPERAFRDLWAAGLADPSGPRRTPETGSERDWTST